MFPHTQARQIGLSGQATRRLGQLSTTPPDFTWEMNPQRSTMRTYPQTGFWEVK
jgi:hypothetical protein